MPHREQPCQGSTETSQPAMVVYQNPPQTVWWVIAVSLAVIATALVVRMDGAGMAQPAMGQTTSAGAHGVFAFSGQLTKDLYGVYMVDVDTGTLWCYEYTGKVMRLVAARSWLHDRYLENHGTSPDLRVVQQMLEDQRAAALQAAGP